MSSFVISKEEYIKAAGFFAGITEQENRYHEPLIYWWSNNKRKLLEAKDYYFAFVSLYEMNAKSVSKQYGDKLEIYNDSEDYKEAFETSKSYAKRLVGFAKTDVLFPLQQACFDFFNFTRSVDYQIEDRKLAAEANKFLNKCNSMLLGVLYQMNHHESDCWGSFSIFDEKEEA